MMCRYFGDIFQWWTNNKCQKSFYKEFQRTKSIKLAPSNFEINCYVLCRIGQGGRACLCA